MKIPTNGLSLGTQAAFARLAFSGALVSAVDIETWAVAAVQTLDAPPFPLLDVCTKAAAGPSAAELGPLLSELEAPGDAALGLAALLDEMNADLGSGALPVVTAVHALSALQWSPPVDDDMQLHIAALDESLDLVDSDHGEINGRKATLDDLRSIATTALGHLSDRLRR